MVSGKRGRTKETTMSRDWTADQRGAPREKTKESGNGGRGLGGQADDGSSDHNKGVGKQRDDGRRPEDGGSEGDDPLSIQRKNR
jgi:hypothetical protein